MTADETSCLVFPSSGTLLPLSIVTSLAEATGIVFAGTAAVSVMPLIAMACSIKQSECEGLTSSKKG